MIWRMNNEYGNANEPYAFRVNAEYDDLADSFWDEYEAIEHEFGVHDCFGEWLNGESVEGFGSYEIEPKDWPTVVQRYHDWFTKNGYVVSELTADELVQLREDV